MKWQTKKRNTLICLFFIVNKKVKQLENIQLKQNVFLL
ncbi:hypothetical protein RV14_GL001669 [Enterococcus ratti]|uniref:Uncharacterized protein n=1 Tax=Enterococcus ratti TaxID=150033 RepID=A0A1L8WQN1_9ENTE|nr:hypothetical protein RV14_GL001669 [Enterococcus ratti]